MSSSALIPTILLVVSMVLFFVAMVAGLLSYKMYSGLRPLCWYLGLFSGGLVFLTILWLAAVDPVIDYMKRKEHCLWDVGGEMSVQWKNGYVRVENEGVKTRTFSLQIGDSAVNSSVRGDGNVLVLYKMEWNTKEMPAGIFQESEKKITIDFPTCLEHMKL